MLSSIVQCQFETGGGFCKVWGYLALPHCMYVCGVSVHVNVFFRVDCPNQVSWPGIFDTFGWLDIGFYLVASISIVS